MSSPLGEEKLMESIATQTKAELGGRWSILTRQREDHVRLDRMLEQLDSARGEALDELLHRISRLVFSHAFAEESVLWPALRRAVHEGEELTAKVEREHQEITELAARLERRPPGVPPSDLLAETVRLLRQDVRDEEDELLPRLQAALSVRELRRLGLLWELVRRTAPTRAHPVVSRRPPGNVLGALPLSVIDRSRDGLEYSRRRVPPFATSALDASSQALASMSSAVERLRPLRRGERPETHVEASSDGQG
jgi:hypothetical protein